MLIGEGYEVYMIGHKNSSENPVSAFLKGFTQAKVSIQNYYFYLTNHKFRLTKF